MFKPLCSNVLIITWFFLGGLVGGGGVKFFFGFLLSQGGKEFETDTFDALYTIIISCHHQLGHMRMWLSPEKNGLPDPEADLPEAL